MKAKGEILIVIGSIGMIIGSIGVIIAGIIATFALAVILGFIGAELTDIPFIDALVALGAVAGLIIVAIGVLYLVLSIMAFRRRNNPLKSTYCIVIGIIFALLSAGSLVMVISGGTLSFEAMGP